MVSLREIMEKENFEIMIPEKKIKSVIYKMANDIAKDYAGKDLHTVIVLNGAVTFSQDLLTALGEKNFPATSDFIGVKSYLGEKSTGEVKITKELSYPIEGRDVLVLEDIFDTGLTLNFLSNYLKNKGAASLEIAVLLNKPSRRLVHGLNPKYVGMEIEDRFVIGYGLDLDEKYRNLKDIWAKK